MFTDPLANAADGGVGQGYVESLLGLVCRELGMETGFIGRITEGQRAFCYVSGPGLNTGDSDPSEETYCQLTADGTIGPAMPNVPERTAARLCPSAQLAHRRFAHRHRTPVPAATVPTAAVEL